MPDSSNVLNIENLVVHYGRGERKTVAVDDISFSIREGECVGFIGPNGAGKSTTIKTIMGFMFPTAGRVHVFGQTAGLASSRQRMGYLPEVALYYPFMKARELLELYGGLQGLNRIQLRQRIPELLEEVGLAGRGETLLKHYSKGMQQRLGIAQAIIADPELLVFDEMSSGLDPVGRYDLRQVLLRLKGRGRTIFFSSHELTEVEDLCDRVLMICHGRLIRSDAVADLLRPMNQYEISFHLSADQMPELPSDARLQQSDGQWCLKLTGSDAYAQVLRILVENGAQIDAAQAHQESLESYFMSIIQQADHGRES
jgi:ABC-2 type transport system ATP-binding protein